VLGMDVSNIWNMALTGLLAAIGFMVQNKMSHLDKLTTLVNRTREELARDHVTRTEVNAALDRIVDRIDASILRLETKIDEMGKK